MGLERPMYPWFTDLEADGEDWGGGSLEHSLRHAAHEDPPQPRPAVRTDYDQVSALPARGAEDLLGRNPVGELGLYPDTGPLRLGDERGQLPLGLAPRPRLEFEIARRQLVTEKRRRRHQDMKQAEARPVLLRQRERPGEGRPRRPRKICGV
jgi:hypothetical protein